ncbi:MAG: tetratricopeptide repeat protein [Deltaproteobacteria bacterium]|nr:tetratricopeptide repeat protein [Deltaproteobacteria bacterium]
MMLALLFVGCLWDAETFKEEALRQKDVAAIVTGKIEKHSPFFYAQKVAYTQKLIDEDAGKEALYDDLAVALHKLGRSEEAITVVAKKRERFGDGYTTLSNLGTFYADQGRYEEATALLQKSIEVNPKAHFGREGYQLKAIAYLQALAATPELVRKRDLLGLAFDNHMALVFADQGRAKNGETHFTVAGLKDDVFVALAGLIRFGSADQSPHVWISLGLALGYKGDRHLSIAAFRRAEKLGHPKAALMGEIAIQQISDVGNSRWDKVGRALDAEFEQGQKWAAEMQRREDERLKRGEFVAVFGY